MSKARREKLYEATMQEWFEGLGCIASAIDSIDWDDPLGLGVEAHKADAAALRDARRVVDALYEAKRHTNEDNIANRKGEVFIPDLLFFSDAAGAFIIVELKASAAAARQALTEVLAYAEVIRNQTRGTQAFIVIAAYQWNPLLDNAVAAQMRSRHFPLLPLEFYEEDGFGLRLRREPFLPRPDANDYFDQHAFRCDSRIYFFEHGDPELQEREIAEARIKEEAQHLAMRGVFGNYSGFVLAWRNSQAWALTTCIFNPARLDLPVTSNPLLGHSDPDWIDIDVGDRLLVQVNRRGLPGGCEFSGQQGWLNQESALIGERARLIDVRMWGKQHDALAAFKDSLAQDAATYTDLSILLTPPNHPFIWIPYLYDMMGMSVDMDIPGLLRFYRLGSAIGAATAYYIGGIDSEGRTSSFGYLAAMGRLLDAWRRVSCHERDGSKDQPLLRFEEDGATLQIHCIDQVATWAWGRAHRAGDWPAFAHRLGFANGLSTFRAGEFDAEEIFDTELDEAVNVKLIEAARAVPSFAEGRGKPLLDYIQHVCWEELGGPTRFSYKSLGFGSTCEAIIALADEWVSFNAGDPAGVDVL